MRNVVNILLISLFIVNSLYAGTSMQKKKADEYIGYYSHLFKYYSKNSYLFSDLENHKNVFSDFQALEDLNKAYNELKYSETLPIVITNNSKDFFYEIDKKVKEEYPDYLHKELEEEMFNKAEKWTGLSNADMFDLWSTALLTGPKIAMDLTAGGIASLGTKLRKGKALKKIIKIGNKWTNIKALSVRNLKKVATALERTSRHLKKTRKLSKLSKRTAIFFDSNIFKITEYLMKQVIEANKTDFNVSISNNEQKKTIEQYIRDNQENKDDAIVQFFIQFSGNSFKLSADLFGKAVGSMFIDLFTTGVLTVYSDKESTNLFISLLTDLGLKGAEFIPIVGPFVELGNKMSELNEKFINEYNQAEANYLNFSAQKNKLYEFYGNVYKLMVIEDSLKAIYSNSNPIYNTSNIDENFGIQITLDNIANSIYEYNDDMPISKIILKKYQKCFFGYLEGKDNSFEEKFNDKKGVATCISNKKIFTVDLNIDTSVKEKDVILYIKLTNSLLYKIPNIGFIDVYRGEFYYPYVNFLAYKNIISGKNDKFNPNDKVTKFEAVKMIENIVFNVEFWLYNVSHSENSKTKNRFNFIKDNIVSIRNIDFDKKDENIDREEFAELVIQLLTKKITDKVIQPVSSNDYITYLNNEQYKSKIDYNKGWDIFSNGLKAIGISDGFEDGTYGGVKKITRGQMAKMMTKVYLLMQKEKGKLK